MVLQFQSSPSEANEPSGIAGASTLTETAGDGFNSNIEQAQRWMLQYGSDEKGLSGLPEFLASSKSDDSFTPVSQPSDVPKRDLGEISPGMGNPERNMVSFRTAVRTIADNPVTSVIPWEKFNRMDPDHMGSLYTRFNPLLEPMRNEINEIIAPRSNLASLDESTAKNKLGLVIRSINSYNDALVKSLNRSDDDAYKLKCMLIGLYVEVDEILSDFVESVPALNKGESKELILARSGWLSNIGQDFMMDDCGRLADFLNPKNTSYGTYRPGEFKDMPAYLPIIPVKEGPTERAIDAALSVFSLDRAQAVIDGVDIYKADHPAFNARGAFIPKVGLVISPANIRVNAEKKGITSPDEIQAETDYVVANELSHHLWEHLVQPNLNPEAIPRFVTPQGRIVRVQELNELFSNIVSAQIAPRRIMDLMLETDKIATYELSRKQTWTFLRNELGEDAVNRILDKETSDARQQALTDEIGRKGVTREQLMERYRQFMLDLGKKILPEIVTKPVQDIQTMMDGQ